MAHEITWFMLLLVTPYYITIMYKSVSQDLRVPEKNRPVFSVVYGLQVPDERLPTMWLPPPYGYLITVTLHGITSSIQNEYWEFASAATVVFLHVCEAAFLFGKGKLAKAGAMMKDVVAPSFVGTFVLTTVYRIYSTGGRLRRREPTAVGADISNTTSAEELLESTV